MAAAGCDWFASACRFPLIIDSDLIYFKDISDHIIAIIDTVDTFREMLASMLDIYLSSVSMKLNEIMKVLTIIATIFMPLTFLAGVYGMNFKYMPELDWPWGYFGILAVMLLIALGMILFSQKEMDLTTCQNGCNRFENMLNSSKKI